jgi:hypothetical protein
MSKSAGSAELVLLRRRKIGSEGSCQGDDGVLPRTGGGLIETGIDIARVNDEAPARPAMSPRRSRRSHQAGSGIGTRTKMGSNAEWGRPIEALVIAAPGAVTIARLHPALDIGTSHGHGQSPRSPRRDRSSTPHQFVTRRLGAFAPTSFNISLTLP